MPDNPTQGSQPTAKSGEMAFGLPEVKRPAEGDDEWDFTVYGNKNVFLAKFIYAGEDAANAARTAIVPVLADAVFIATEES
jgi:hypothetical protein